MKVLYSRVSSQSQNEERQIQNTDGFDYVLVDRCSGLIPFWERPQGSQIKKLIDSNQLTHLEIHSIDRLGRNTLDVLVRLQRSWTLLFGVNYKKIADLLLR